MEKTQFYGRNCIKPYDDDKSQKQLKIYDSKVWIQVWGTNFTQILANRPFFEFWPSVFSFIWTRMKKTLNSRFSVNFEPNFS